MFKLNKKYFILLNGLFFFLSLFLFFKILNSQPSHQNIYKFKKEDILSESTNSASLKYFYQNLSNSVRSEKPNWLDYKATYYINSDGMNSIKDYAFPKKQGVYRIIMLGDSLVFGLFVNTNDNFSSLLEDKLNNVLFCDSISHFEVINFGMPGYDIQYAVERYKIKGKKYEPDLVIFLVNNWNFDRVNEWYFPITKELELSGTPGYVPELGKVLNLSQAENIMKLRYSKSELIEYQKKALFRLKDFYKGKLILASFSNLKSEYKILLKQFVITNKNFNSVDNITDITNIKNYHFQDDLHPNIQGHQKLAQDFYMLLKTNLLSKCEERNNLRKNF